MAFPAWDFYFFPLIQVFLITYGLILVLLDIIFACSITTVASIAAAIFYLGQTQTPVGRRKTAHRFFDITTENHNKIHDNDPEHFVVAHRTTSLDAPENSLAGIRMAKSAGAKAVHFDVRLTSDDVAVLFHDEDLDRVTTETGKLCQRTLDQVKTLDISSKTIEGSKFMGEKIPTLEEAVELCLQLQLKMVVQFKVSNWEVSSRILHDLINQHEQLSEGMMMVASESPIFLYRVCREFDGDLATCLVWRPRLFSQSCPTGFLHQTWPIYKDLGRKALAHIADVIYAWALPRIIWKVCNADAVILHAHSLSVESVKQWTKTSVRVLAWPVNSPTDKMYTEQTLKIGYLTDIFSTNVPN